jgi:hypothetical protein
MSYRLNKNKQWIQWTLTVPLDPSEARTPWLADGETCHPVSNELGSWSRKIRKESGHVGWWRLVGLSLSHSATQLGWQIETWFYHVLSQSIWWTTTSGSTKCCMVGRPKLDLPGVLCKPMVGLCNIYIPAGWLFQTLRKILFSCDYCTQFMEK